MDSALRRGGFEPAATAGARRFGAGREPDRGAHGRRVVFGGVMGQHGEGRAREMAGEMAGRQRGIAALGRFDDALVLFGGNREGARHAFDVQPAVPIGVIVQLANRAHQAIARVRHEGEVKFAIDGLPLPQVVARERLHAAEAVDERVDVALGESRDVMRMASDSCTMRMA